MDKQHFLSLLYLLGISPILFAMSGTFSGNSQWFLFGIFNIIALLLFALLASKASMQKKSVWLAVVGGLLLLGVVGSGLYKLGSGASDWLYNKALAPQEHTQTQTQDIQPEETPSQQSEETLSWDLHTGAILTHTGEIQTHDDQALPDYPASSGTNTPTVTGDTFGVNEAQPSTTPTSTTETTYTTVLPAQGNLNYAQVIPYLVNTYKLKNSSGKSYNFTNITKSNVLYAPFNIAASKAMIGEKINPASKVSCNTYLVLKGMAAGWDVNYTGTPQAAYRAKAGELNQVNGCKDGAFVTKTTL